MFNHQTLSKMMSTIENPKITLTELNQIEDRVRSNKASVKDYELLDNYLSFLGYKNFLITKFKNEGIDSYEEFIYKREKVKNAKIHSLIGVIFGIISFLKKTILGKT